VSGSGANGRDDATEAITAPAVAEAEPAPEEAGAGSEGGLAAVAVTPADESQELLRERDDLRAQLLRRRAEFENFRKRVERDTRTASVDAAAEVLRRLVDTLDNLERALAAQGGEGPLRQGVELTLRDMRAAFESLGVSVLDPAGQPFDPLHHQALQHEPVPGVPAGTVAEVFRKGYAYKDRLLRPALVKVSSGDADGGQDVH
jgi:molecular chaperone GrpE